jgi:serine/threonine protein kinase/Tfp pilus assembly protein PilF
VLGQGLVSRALSFGFKHRISPEEVHGSAMASSFRHTSDLCDPLDPFATRSENRSAPEAPKEQLIEEMIRRWRIGEQPVAEDFLDCSPGLWNKPEEALEIIYEEMCLRNEYRQPATLEQYLQRFPQWAAQLRVLFECQHVLGSDTASLHVSGPGESIGDFRLLAQLGHGANGRVFLATQASLADRPIVVKLTPAEGQEHLSLARLQHTHIVPLYAVYDDTQRGLRALCMPYFGGGAFDRILDALRSRPPSLRTGQDLVRALEQVHSATPDTKKISVGGPLCDWLAQMSYARAVCWIGARLADALQYAQDRGLVHFDLKPSNVLLAADGQPMLLDFHLARGPVQPNGPPPVWLGGTPAFMAPEQRAAVDALRAGRQLPGPVDGRADIYALGLFLDQALGGTRLAGTTTAPAPLYVINPQVSVGLSDIIDKCLSRLPADRYPNAGALALDLGRHLSEIPLEGVANRSFRERWQKWRRRRPHAAATGAWMLLCLGITFLAAFYVIQQRDGARTARADAQVAREMKYFDDAQRAVRRGLALAERLPFNHQLVADLTAEQKLIDQELVVKSVSDTVDEIRFRIGGHFSSANELQGLESSCQALWEKRDNFLTLLHSEPDEQVAQQLRGDLLDVAVLWTDFRVRLAPAGDVISAHRLALDTLNQAERLLGPSTVLYLARQYHCQALGQAAQAREAERRAAAFPPRTAREHYALARFHLQAGVPSSAAEELERALRLQPESFWTNFLKGQCAYQRNNFQDALLAFNACVVLRPKTAWCYYNRALAHTGLGQIESSVEDYGLALERDPKLAVAALNRGVLHFQLKRFAQAESDLQRASHLGADPATVHYNLALIQAQQGHRDAAVVSLKLALTENADHKKARELLSQLEHSH